MKNIGQELCKDAISRQAVLSKIKEVCFSEEWLQFRVDKGSNGQRDFLIDYIEQLLPATPQPKTGHWIDQYNDGDWHCSKCGAIVEKDEQINHNWYFCYHCGARMVKPQAKKE